jgi:hypothetical protein
VVVGPGMEAVAAEARGVFPQVRTAIQEDRLGTAHAVSMAKPALGSFSGTVLVLYGDVPLIGAESLRSWRSWRAAPAWRCWASRLPIPTATAGSSATPAAMSPPSARSLTQAPEERAR